MNYSFTIVPTDGDLTHLPGETKMFTATRTPIANGTVTYYIETSTIDPGYFIGFGPGLAAGATLLNGVASLPVKIAPYAPLVGMYRVRMIGLDASGNSVNYYSDYVTLGAGYLNVTLWPAGVTSVPYDTNGVAKVSAVLHNAVVNQYYTVRMRYIIDGQAIDVGSDTFRATTPTRQTLFSLDNTNANPLSATLRSNAMTPLARLS